MFYGSIAELQSAADTELLIIIGLLIINAIILCRVVKGLENLSSEIALMGRESRAVSREKENKAVGTKCKKEDCYYYSDKQESGCVRDKCFYDSKNTHRVDSSLDTTICKSAGCTYWTIGKCCLDECCNADSYWT